jgi:hypothetical protein
MSKNIFGLREKIANATSEQEVITLLKTGQTYEFASPRTQNSWKNTGYRTLERLKSVIEVESKGDNSKETRVKTKKIKK